MTDAVGKTTRDGWTWNSVRCCWERGAWRVYETEGGFVISDGGTWLPGTFATFEAAAEVLANDP